MDVAAHFCHNDCMRIAHERGVSSDDIIVYLAISCGHVDCLRYAHAHGAPAVRDGYTPRAFLVTEDNWDCFRFISLHLPSWPGIPPKMAVWRARVRATAATILRIVRRNRAHHAATVIQRFWLDRHYAPEGRGADLALARLR